MDYSKINFDAVYAHFVRQLEARLKDLPEELRDRPVVAPASSGGRPLTPRDIVQEVRAETALGRQLFEANLGRLLTRNFF